MKAKGVAIAFLLIIFTTLFTVPTAMAEEETQYSIDEAGLSFSLPSSMKVITRNTPTDSDLYKTYNASPDELEKYDVYLQGYSQDNTQIFTVMVNEDESSKSVYNYNLLEEAQLEAIRDNYNNDENCTSCSMDKYNDAVYFDSIIQNVQDDTTVYMAQADTVVNGKYVHFILESKDGEVGEADKALMAQVLQSAKYTIENDPAKNNAIFTLLWIVGTVLLVVIIAVLIFVLIRKQKKKKSLKDINNKMYNQDKIERESREYKRKHRNTATGAERPDAFFDVIDGLESSKSIDKIERELIQDAHKQRDQLEQQKKDFLEPDKDNKKSSLKNKSSKRKSKKNSGSSSRKF